MSKFVRLEQVIVVNDQALHAKATEVAWKHVHTCKHHGHFPYHHERIASNGKRFQYVEFILICVGLRDMCIVPGIIAERKLSGVSYGRMYNRAVQSWKDGGNTSRI